MTKIRKAVITAASPRQRALAVQSLVDRDGETKSALRILLEEVESSGVEEIAVVICPGDEGIYRTAAGPCGKRSVFIEQHEAKGYGHALTLARSWVGDARCLHLVGDHLYVSREAATCAHQLVEVATREQCAVSGVQPTRERLLPYFGAVGGRRMPGVQNVYLVDDVVEKPTPTEAERRLVISGLRTGHYLCFFGMHVLTPVVFEILANRLSKAEDTGALSFALAELASKERYLAAELNGVRYDIGDRYGLWTAQLALGLTGRDREELLARMVEMLALRG